MRQSNVKRYELAPKRHVDIESDNPRNDKVDKSQKWMAILNEVDGAVTIYQRKIKGHLKHNHDGLKTQFESAFRIAFWLRVYKI